MAAAQRVALQFRDGDLAVEERPPEVPEFVAVVGQGLEEPLGDEALAALEQVEVWVGLFPAELPNPHGFVPVTDGEQDARVGDVHPGGAAFQRPGLHAHG